MIEPGCPTSGNFLSQEELHVRDSVSPASEKILAPIEYALCALFVGGMVLGIVLYLVWETLKKR
jgi:hypothetical protein